MNIFSEPLPNPKNGDKLATVSYNNTLYHIYLNESEYTTTTEKPPANAEPIADDEFKILFFHECDRIKVANVVVPSEIVNARIKKELLASQTKLLRNSYHGAHATMRPYFEAAPVKRVIPKPPQRKATKESDSVYKIEGSTDQLVFTEGTQIMGPGEKHVWVLLNEPQLAPSAYVLEDWDSSLEELAKRNNISFESNSPE